VQEKVDFFVGVGGDAQEEVAEVDEGIEVNSLLARAFPRPYAALSAPAKLIIQDELHLISGPLGSMVGLYETAVDELCSWTVAGKRVRPKVIASTATIRRAPDQVNKLFLRQLEVFPPHGTSIEDNFFSVQRAPSEKYPGRRYLGICAIGRRYPVATIRVYVALLAAAKRLYDQYDALADPWMTLAGYFNSIRELGGTRRLVEDDIRSRLRDADKRGLAKRRPPFLRELTSRVSGTDIPVILDLLDIGFNQADDKRREAQRKANQKVDLPDPLDVVLATNRISVGVDVDRLGLMAVSGQPKTTAEYIQATSRVGRRFPGAVRVTLLGASNSWFPITLSVLSIPRSEDKAAQLVEDNWAKLQKVRSVESLHDAREIGLFPSLAEFTDDEIWQAIEKKRSGDTGSSQSAEDLKTPEWNILSAASPSIATADFKLQAIAPPKGYERFITKTVLVERIREVGALLSFTRVESPGDFFDGVEVPAERQAPLSRSAPMWVPASEVRGEGLFLQFNLQQLEMWQNKKAVQARQREFFEAHQEWRRLRKIEPTGAGFPGIWYVLLHSFAHALMRQLSLECGYTAASVRERIYARMSGQGADTMAGVLIYTAAPDSEGTLGGLVSLGMPDVLGRHIDQALEQVHLCASDPLCAEHQPVAAMTIHGAACHACLFAPETSCERGNKYLDRATLVQTYASADLAFFG
jgi:hypothetical protein